MRVRQGVVLIMVAAVVLAPALATRAAPPGIPPIMPLAEVKPGMRGIGRTVIQGQKIEEFSIEVIGILRGGGGIIPVRHLILFRTSGPVIDRSGGTAAGMSGSPLYINGRLIGALSAGYLFQPDKRDLALATPIEEMLPVLDLPTGGSARAEAPWPRVFAADPPVRVGAQTISRVVIAQTLAEAQRIDAAGLPGTTAFIPATFPAMVSGLSPRALRLLQQVLGPAQPLRQYDDAPTSFVAAPITGGSSVGILQVRGDITFGGICTVTLRVGDKLLICGHPWELLGEVEYALTTSDVITVVRTLERPFKEANLGDLIGKIDQDRGPAIRGILGQMPRMFAVRVEVFDRDTGKRVVKGMQVVRRRDLAKVFTTAMTLTAIDRARDQVLGGGTATVRMTVRARGLPRPLTRENVFYNSRDVALAALLDLPDALNFLFYNDLAAVDPTDVRVEVGLSSRRQTAALVEAQVEQREVSPGDRLRVRLRLRPYQEAEVVSRVVEVAIPRNYPRGPAVLVVAGAGKQIPVEFPLEQRLTQFLLKEPEPSPATTLEEAIQLFEDFGKSTDILMQLVPFGLPTEGREFVKFDVFAGEIVRTDWVIQGQVQIPVLVR
ncbi:MAG: SpoIVB peptidase S55 domain-containing protein [Armatimonadota bacterium]|nr:SpoIVB peptidase S55 domain-containing protein [Armatimonadota bacterium]